MSNDPERPSFEFEGKRYERRSGEWFDVLTRIKAPAHLSRRIDASAKNDRTLWQRCGDQDFTDDPKNRGRVLLKRIDVFADQLPGDSEMDGMPPRPASGGKRRLRIGENLTASFRKSGSELVVQCDLEAGWHETGSGWVFQESDRLEIFGYPLRVSAKFIEHTFGQWRRRTTSDAPAGGSRPAAGASLDEMCPTFRYAECELGEGIRLMVNGGTSKFAITLLDSAGELNPALPWNRVGPDWRFKSHYSAVYEVPIRMSDGRSQISRPIYIEIEAVLHEPPQPTLPPEYAERTPFASGGLPSLGKRR